METEIFWVFSINYMLTSVFWYKVYIRLNPFPSISGYKDFLFYYKSILNFM